MDVVRPGKLRLADRVGRNVAPVGVGKPSAPDIQPPKKQPRETPEGGDELAASTSTAPPATKAQRTDGSARASKPTTNHGDTSSASHSGRRWTVTVALPGSIVENAQTHELRSYLVGQVARACAIHNVDEIVVFSSESSNHAGAGAKKGSTNGSIFMARVLQYLECPQYLRKQLFPHHPDLRSVGLIPPLDAPHQLRIDEKCAAVCGLVLCLRLWMRAACCRAVLGVPWGGVTNGSG